MNTRRGRNCQPPCPKFAKEDVQFKLIITEVRDFDASNCCVKGLFESIMIKIDHEYYSKCGQNGHAGKMALSVDILAGQAILKCNYIEMTAVHYRQDLRTALNISRNYVGLRNMFLMDTRLYPNFSTFTDNIFYNR